ncbi:MAG: DUF72 domain-containing protein [Planctomycetes bacterium]|nr:DUF72 domain-containing protein [Planctomycetota bacterium]
MATLHLGTSGWSYASWVGPFYPEGLKPGDFLAHYASVFSCVEVDSTFYAVPSARTVQRWKEVTPPGFLFCPKAPRAVTHEKRLADCEAEWDDFLKTMELLGDKLGIVVLQFDSSFRYEHREALKRFAPRLPTGHRFAIELRDRSWLKIPFAEWLRERGIALVLQDHPSMPRLAEVTAEFTYVRLLGRRSDIPGEDFSRVVIRREAELPYWARTIRQFLAEGTEVYAFSNNRYQGHAPATVRSLLEEMARPENRA